MVHPVFKGLLHVFHQTARRKAVTRFVEFHGVGRLPGRLTEEVRA
jgi:hypothetical protein